MSTATFKERVRELAKLPHNQKCADCNEREPDWASTNLGIFFCINCSGIHRRLGVHISKVRSVKLDDWDEEQFQAVSKTGNEEGNKYWEATLPSYFLRADEAPNNTEVRENFIRAKYERKEFIPNAPALKFIKEGLLMKLSPRGSDRWQERWFVLNGTVLAYYGKKGDANPKKSVDTAAGETRFAEGGKKPGHGFVISLPNREYKLWHEDVKAKAARDRLTATFQGNRSAPSAKKAGMRFFPRAQKQPLLDSSSMGSVEPDANEIEFVVEKQGRSLEATGDNIVRFSTNSIRIIDQYESPSPQSGDSKLSAVASVIQGMVVHGSQVRKPIILDEFEMHRYVRRLQMPRFFCCPPKNTEAGTIPDPEDVAEYIKTIIEAAGMSFDVSIVALILLERFVKKTNLTVRPGNWKPLVVAGTLVACKTWGDDEVFFTNSHISAAFQTTEFNLSHINTFERHFLNLISYDVSVSQSLYSERYFQLTSRASRSDSRSGRWAAIAKPENAFVVDEAASGSRKNPEGAVEDITEGYIPPDPSDLS